jgi:O-antigen ligase
MFIKNKKIVFLIFLFLAIIMVAATSRFKPAESRLSVNFILNKLQNDPRIQYWHYYFRIVKDYPVFGMGFDMDDMWHDQKLWDKYSAGISFPLRLKNHIICPHNIFISITVRLGLVGLVLFVFIIFVFVRMSWIIVIYGKNDFIKSWGLCIMAVFVAWFIKGLFEPALSHVPAIINYTIFAMMTILWNLNTKPDSQMLHSQYRKVEAKNE